MKDLRIVGQMYVRNEVDIIEETVMEAFRWLDVIRVLDGASDDGTLEKLKGLMVYATSRGKTIEILSRPDPDEKFHDEQRQELHEWTMHEEPDWIVSIDADEIFDRDPRPAIYAAEEKGATIVRCLIPQFWMTFDDLRNGLEIEDESISVQKRRRWYSWGWEGIMIWKALPGIVYPPGVISRDPKGIERLYWPRFAILKHYPFRSLRQAIKRREERLARRKVGGLFGKYTEASILIDEERCRLHYRGSDDGPWDCTNNHHRIYDWFKSVRSNYEERGL